MTASLHILGSRQLGGADQFYVRLLGALHQEGHPVLAVNRPHAPVIEPLHQAGIPQVQVPMANQWDLWSVWRIRKLLRRWQPAVVQTYMGRASRLTRLPKGCGIGHVARLGGYYKIDGYYRHAHAWVGNTQGVCDYLIRCGLPAARIYKIGNFVPPPIGIAAEHIEHFQQSWRIPPAARVIASAGRMIPGKGFEDLISAFAKLPATSGGRPLWLALAGAGPWWAQLQRWARELEVDARIAWTGWLDPPDPLYRLAEVFVCPSRHETLGNVILEAWNHRLPVLATATRGATELIDPGVNGVLTEVGQPELLAEALGAVLALSPGERDRLGQTGWHQLQRQHSQPAVVQAYQELYRELS